MLRPFEEEKCNNSCGFEFLNACAFLEYYIDKENHSRLGERNHPVFTE